MEHWSWLHRSSWMLTGLLWAFWLFKVWFLWLASKHALDLDVNFISSLGEGSWIVQSVGCQLAVTTRDCWKEKFRKESAKWSLCFRESFKLGPFWIRWSSRMIMHYERCQDLFSSDLTPLKTRSHRPLMKHTSTLDSPCSKLWGLVGLLNNSQKVYSSGRYI